MDKKLFSHLILGFGLLLSLLPIKRGGLYH